MLRPKTMKAISGALLAAALLACASTDERINQRVKERIANEPTPLVQMRVSTSDRIVHLEGVVSDERERDRLERIIRDMDDVLGVDNRLTVARPVQTTGERK